MDEMKSRKERCLDRSEAVRLAHLLKIERELQAGGMQHIAGIDEAGRGPLAGPVCAAAVVFPPGTRIAGVDDSKKLAPELREEIYDEIVSSAAGYGIGFASAQEIDAINILNATKLAVKRALRQMQLLPDLLLLDALTLRDCTIPQKAFVKGDARCFSIAAASILAKVTRDRLMAQYHLEYPQFQFDQHKGYSTDTHWERIMAHGISSLHRKTFFDPGFLAPEPLCSCRFNTLMDRIRGAQSAEQVREILRQIRECTGFLPECELEKLTEAAITQLDGAELQEQLP